MNYSQSLRAIGQSLEALRLTAFDIQSEENAYLIRDRSAEEGEPGRDAAPGPADVFGSDPPFNLHYTYEDLVRLEIAGKSRRRDPRGTPDAYSLSQLLRAVGAYVNHKNGRLLGLCWREQWAAIIYETENRREVEILRRSSIYDFWVRMYVMRRKANS